MKQTILIEKVSKTVDILLQSRCCGNCDCIASFYDAPLDKLYGTWGIAMCYKMTEDMSILTLETIGGSGFPKTKRK